MAKTSFFFKGIDGRPGNNGYPGYRGPKVGKTLSTNN